MTILVIGLEQFAKPHSYNYAFDDLIDLERVSMLLNYDEKAYVYIGMSGFK